MLFTVGNCCKLTGVQIWRLEMRDEDGFKIVGFEMLIWSDCKVLEEE